MRTAAPNADLAVGEATLGADSSLFHKRYREVHVADGRSRADLKPDAWPWAGSELHQSEVGIGAGGLVLGNARPSNSSAGSRRPKLDWDEL
mgnify:CR=1 FL=1